MLQCVAVSLGLHKFRSDECGVVHVSVLAGIDTVCCSVLQCVSVSLGLHKFRSDMYGVVHVSVLAGIDTAGSLFFLGILLAVINRALFVEYYNFFDSTYGSYVWLCVAVLFL